MAELEHHGEVLRLEQRAEEADDVRVGDRTKDGRLTLRIGRRLEPAVAACASAPHALLTGVGRVSTILLVKSCGVSLLAVARPSLSATGARQ